VHLSYSVERHCRFFETQCRSPLVFILFAVQTVLTMLVVKLCSGKCFPPQAALCHIGFTPADLAVMPIDVLVTFCMYADFCSLQTIFR